MVNSKKSSTRSKSKPKAAVRARNASVQDTPPTSPKEINKDEESVSDIIQQVVNKNLLHLKKLLKP